MTDFLISNNYTQGRGGKTPRYVVIHTYGGSGTNLQAWFNDPSTLASAHFSVLFNGEVLRYVREEDTAWHSGVFSVNQESIGIEHQDNNNPGDSVRTNELYESSAQLIASFYRKYNWDINDKGLIKPHNEFVVGRVCPGGLDLDRLKERVFNILHNTQMKYFFEGREVTVDGLDKAIKEFVKEPRIVRQNDIRGPDVQHEFWQIKARQDAIEDKDKQIKALQGEIKVLNGKVSTRDEMIRKQQEDSERLLNSYNLEVENNNSNKKEILKLKKEIEELKQSNSFEKLIIFGFDTGLYKRKTLIN